MTDFNLSNLHFPKNIPGVVGTFLISLTLLIGVLCYFLIIVKNSFLKYFFEVLICIFIIAFLLLIYSVWEFIKTQPDVANRWGTASKTREGDKDSEAIRKEINKIQDIKIQHSFFNSLTISDLILDIIYFIEPMKDEYTEEEKNSELLRAAKQTMYNAFKIEELRNYDKSKIEKIVKKCNEDLNSIIEMSDKYKPLAQKLININNKSLERL